MSMTSKDSLQPASREGIMAIRARAPATEVLEVPEWAMTVRVRALTAREFLHIDAVASDAPPAPSGKGGQRAQAKTPLGSEYRMASFAAYGCVDEDGARLFSDEDIPELAELGLAPLMRIVGAISRLSGLTASADQIAEEMVRNPLGSLSTS